MERPIQFVIKPNCSLSWRGNVRLIAWIGTVTAIIAVTFASFGMWVILPFAGLEIAALTLGLYYCCLKNQTREVISIVQDTVEVSFGRQQPRRSFKFLRPWTKIELLPAQVIGYPSKLYISSHGKMIEIGACLNEEERKGLASSLREVIGCK